MNKVLWIAWREFKHTALTKAFIVAAIFVPLLIVGSIYLLGPLLKPRIAPLKGTLVVVAGSTTVTDAVRDEMSPDRIRERQERSRDRRERRFGSAGAPGSEAEMVNPAEVMAEVMPLPSVEVKVEAAEAGADVEALKNKVRVGEIIAVAVVKDDALAAGQSEATNTFDLFVASDSAPNHTTMFEDALSDAIVRLRVGGVGLDMENTRWLMRRPDANTRRVAEDGGEASENVAAKMIIPMAFMTLLWIATFSSGNYLLTSTIEEKSNKVIEVLLSAVSPLQLMAGKIIGQAGVAFILLLMYGGLGIAALIAFAMMDLVPIIHLVYLLVFFVMGFFMVASMMAGVGSAVSELREAQSLITPVMMLLMIPLILWLPITENPNGVLATVTSFIPPLIPFVMILRVTAASEPVPLWQIISSIVVGYAWMFVMIWMCAKIFRVGVLMYGKPPNPLELLRWVRYR